MYPSDAWAIRHHKRTIHLHGTSQQAWPSQICHEAVEAATWKPLVNYGSDLELHQCLYGGFLSHGVTP